jgi:hypothetical protein
MTLHTPELLRQNEAHKAIQARLWGKKGSIETKAEPIAIKEPKRKLVQLDYHVWLYRRFKIRYGAAISTRASFSLTPYQNYTPYETRVVFDLAPSRKSMKDIAMDVLYDFPGVTLAEIKGSHRSRSIVEARQLTMYEIHRQRPDLSYPAIGRFLNKDHTTVLHAVKKIAAMKDTANGK